MSTKPTEAGPESAYEVILDRDEICIRKAQFNEGIKQVTHWPDPCEFKHVKGEVERLLHERDALRASFKSLLEIIESEIGYRSDSELKHERDYADKVKAAKSALAITDKGI